MSDDLNGSESPEPTQPTLPAPKPASNGLVAAALVLPVLAGVALMVITSVGPAIAVSAATVLATSILVALDARRLGRVDLKGKRRESAGALLLVMCALWILAYPIAFFRRRHFGGPNLTVPAVLVALFFLGGPILRSVLLPPPLPTCDSGDVVKLVDQVIRTTALGTKAKSIDGHREIRYDSAAGVRHGECVVHSEGPDVVVQFLVKWRDREKAIFEVRFPPRLPECDSSEVAQLINQVIRSTPAGTEAKAIEGHREISYDPATDVRKGQCFIQGNDGKYVAVNYVVQWRDREKGEFEVKMFP